MVNPTAGVPRAHQRPPPNEMLPLDKAEAFFDDIQRIELARLLSNATDATLELRDGSLLQLRNRVLDDLHRAVHVMERHGGPIEVNAQKDSLKHFLDSYHKTCQSLVTVATLGGGFTFTVIFASIAPPRAEFTVQRVKQTLGIAWLIFTLALIWASLLAIMLSGSSEGVFTVPDYRRAYDKHLVFIIALLLGALLVVAEALRYYDKNVGIAALVLIGLAMLILILFVVVARSAVGKLLWGEIRWD